MKESTKLVLLTVSGVRSKQALIFIEHGQLINEPSTPASSPIDSREQLIRFPHIHLAPLRYRIPILVTIISLWMMDTTCLQLSIGTAHSSGLSNFPLSFLQDLACRI